MANFYVSMAAINDMPIGNDGTGAADNPNLPFLTFAAAQTAASNGDTIWVNDGTYDLGSSRFVITKNIRFLPMNRFKVTISSTHATDVLDILPANNANIIEIGAFIVAPRGACPRAILCQNVAFDVTVKLNGVWTFAGTNAAVTCSLERGTFIVQGLVGTGGYGNSSYIEYAANSGQTAPMQQIITDCNIDVVNMQGTPSTASILAPMRQAGATPSEVTVIVRRNRIKQTIQATQGTSIGAITIRVQNARGSIVTDNDVTVIVPNGTGVDSTAISLYSITSTAPCGDGYVANNKVRVYSPAARCIQIGDGAVQSYVDNCEVVRNEVWGQWNASATPHGITLGRVTGGWIHGNIVHDTYAGILASINQGGVIAGNLLIGCYGPALFSKGCGATTAVYFLNNTVIGKNTVGIKTGTYGMIGVAVQSAVNNANTIFAGNMLYNIDMYDKYVQSDASQVATFEANNYYSEVAMGPAPWAYSGTSYGSLRAWLEVGTTDLNFDPMMDYDINNIPDPNWGTRNRQLWGKCLRAAPRRVRDFYGRKFYFPSTIGCVEMQQVRGSDRRFVVQTPQA